MLLKYAVVKNLKEKLNEVTEQYLQSFRNSGVLQEVEASKTTIKNKIDYLKGKQFNSSLLKVCKSL